MEQYYCSRSSLCKILINADVAKGYFFRYTNVINYYYSIFDGKVYLSRVTFLMSFYFYCYLNLFECSIRLNTDLLSFFISSLTEGVSMKIVGN